MFFIGTNTHAAQIWFETEKKLTKQKIIWRNEIGCMHAKQIYILHMPHKMICVMLLFTKKHYQTNHAFEGISFKFNNVSLGSVAEIYWFFRRPCAHNCHHITRVISQLAGYLCKQCYLTINWQYRAYRQNKSLGSSNGHITKWWLYK